MASRQTDPRALELADRVFGLVEVITGSEEYHTSDPEDPLGRLHIATSLLLRNLSLAATEAAPTEYASLLRVARRHAATGVHLLVGCCEQGLPQAESVLETMAGVVRELDEILRDRAAEAEA